MAHDKSTPAARYDRAIFGLDHLLVHNNRVQYASKHQQRGL